MCSEKRQGSPPLFGVWRSTGVATAGGNGRLNGLQAIDGQGWLKRGLIQGFNAGES
jgi:hypothetical protein